MKKMTVFVLLFLFIFGLTGCGSDERVFNEDIEVTLQDPSEKIIIKEWSFLLGSGAEIYYQKDNSEPILLGKTTGADNGFCPFLEGMYEITQEENKVIVSWCFKPSDVDRSSWRSESFELPND